MVLTPPPNYTNAVLSGVAGFALALVVWLLTKSTLPHVGDREHSLPHGGLYKDGTKQVNYYKPCKLNSIEGHNRGLSFQPWALVLLLVLLVVLSERFNSKRCNRCSVSHA
ncbi:12K [Carlavirus latensaconiti]|uniref:Movement protein TGB2 n=1 Tax=Carlavirus latensaconiti TaxID=101764 RepID=Q91UJ1_9VIRU|nr:12K protein [Aconitum latent virus]BAB56116.1 12K [Aconitum latent virus]